MHRLAATGLSLISWLAIVAPPAAQVWAVPTVNAPHYIIARRLENLKRLALRAANCTEEVIGFGRLRCLG